MLKIKDMNSNNVIRQGDSQPREYQLDTGNLNLNLANKQATIRLMTGDYKGIAYETTAAVSSENKISFSIDDIIPAREYRLEITVDDYVFPSRALDGQFNVDPSSHGQEVNIIQIIGKDEIVRDVKEQVEDGLQPFLGEIEQSELDRQAQEEAREANESVRTEGMVKLENLVENGDFENGSTGWITSPSSSIVNGELKNITNGLEWRQDTPVWDTQHKYFYSMDIRRLSGAAPAIFTLGLRSDMVNYHGDLTVTRKVTGTVESNGGMFRLGIYSNDEAVEFYYDNVLLIDLTQTFGAGNEPTKEQMDFLMQHTGYFNGTTLIPQSAILAMISQKANQSSLEAEKSRIDNLINLSEGFTANAAQLEDIKIGTDGTVYSSPGTAVRTQLNEKAPKFDMTQVEDFELGYVNINGQETESTKHARSPIYNLPEGTKIKLNRSSEHYIGFNTAADQNIPHGAGQYYGQTVYEATITKERPYVRFFITRIDGGELNLADALVKNITEVGHKAIYQNDLTSFVRGSELVTLDAKKADSTLAKPVTDFELGYVDISGKNIESTTRVRSSVYKLTEGTKIRLVRGSSYLIGFNTSSRADNISHGGGQFYGESVYEATITKEKPYVRFFIMRADNGTINIADALAKNVTTIGYKVLYENTLVNLPSNAIETESLRSSNFNSSFRTPSRAEGGVVTFIDDDGKKGVYDILYPLFKRKNVPFGIAIVTDWIDNQEDVMTLEQLKEIASDREIIEVMNHTKNHPSLASTDEAFIHEQVSEAKRWFAKNGFDATGLVLPYGESNKVSQNIIQQYYNACYDFGNYFPESFDNIRNQLIVRDSWDYAIPDEDPLDGRKLLVDQAASENKWLIITTHVGNSPTYWNETSESGLEELIDYIQSKGIKILSPKEGFQTFGNLVENDSGFKIQANGKIVGAK